MSGQPEPIRPTEERISKADHIADDGKPTVEKPYVRPQRLGTAWDKYCRTKNRNGNPLPDSELVLTRAQIAAGEHYAGDYVASMWGEVRASKTEPSIRGAETGVPAHSLDRRKSLWRADAQLATYEQVMLQAVILDGATIEEWASARRMFAKAPLWYLREALTKLALHYGYTKEPVASRAVGG